MTALLMCIGSALSAQENGPLRDTLSASIKVAELRSGPVNNNHYLIIPDDLKTLVVPFGSGDIVKYIQTVPGVSTGIEGSSSLYVRGSNNGNSRICLDGIPLYGSTHLLGFVQSVPNDILAESKVEVGSFSAESGNYTASQIQLITNNVVTESSRTIINLDEAMASVTGDYLLSKDVISLTVSGRISPASLWAGLLDNTGVLESSGLSDIGVNVYDVYGKVNFRINHSNSLSASIFSTGDYYKYRYNKTDSEIEWSNQIALLDYNLRTASDWKVSAGLSWDRFLTRREENYSVSSENTFTASSFLSEYALNAKAEKTKDNGFRFISGLELKRALLIPGSTFDLRGGLMPDKSIQGLSGEALWSDSGTLYSEMTLARKDRYEISFGGRLNEYRIDDGSWGKFVMFPEYDLSGRLYVDPYCGLRASIDSRVQFYHLLEGLPTGWSLDMYIPSDKRFLPETGFQKTIGVFARKDGFNFSLDYYVKKMDNLISLKNASDMFSPSLLGWEYDISVGKGSSQGFELFSEYSSEKCSYRLAYTISNTDRTFPGLNGGNPFPFKYDRRHILNLGGYHVIRKSNTDELAITCMFTWQSGYWETVAEGYFEPWMFGPTDYHIDYFSGINNYKMPPYIRVDVGSVYIWTRNRIRNQLQLGIFNLLNRHNPFTLIFDTDDYVWKQISLFPILPSIGYTMKF